ncbi:MAG TPA: hypothetical protein VEL07_01915 [Planctomycetota bacterium]|nr:hypothetical protein [Planctomycetota bacterium]
MWTLARIKRSRLLADLARRTPWRYPALRERLAALERASLTERRDFAAARLRRVLAAAATSAHGRAHAGRPLSAWPMPTSAEVRGREADFVAGSRWLGRRLGVPATTSGTTGTPLALRRPFAALPLEQAMIDGVLASAGVDARSDRIAVLRGDPISGGVQAWRVVEGGRRLVMGANALGLDNVAAYVAALAEYGPRCLSAFPSSLHALCALMRLAGLRLHIPLALTSSEVLEPATVALAKQVLGCRIVDHYGQAERVAFAADLGDGYRFLPGYAWIELPFVTERDGEALHEIVGTSLWNTLMPLVRFRTGDLIAVAAGTTLAQLEEIRFGLRPVPRIIGRLDGAWVDGPDQRRITGLSALLSDARRVQRWQIVQEAPGDLRLLIIPEPGFEARDVDRALASARARLPAAVGVRIEVVDRLERTAAGKAPFVLRRRQDAAARVA